MGKKVIDCSFQRGPQIFIFIMTYAIEEVLQVTHHSCVLNKSTSEEMDSSRQ